MAVIFLCFCQPVFVISTSLNNFHFPSSGSKKNFSLSLKYNIDFWNCRKYLINCVAKGLCIKFCFFSEDIIINRSVSFFPLTIFKVHPAIILLFTFIIFLNHTLCRIYYYFHSSYRTGCSRTRLLLFSPVLLYLFHSF